MFAQRQRERFCVSCGDPSPALEVQESVFDQVTRTVNVLISGAGFFPVPPRRDDGLAARSTDFIPYLITVIPPVRQQKLRIDAFDQREGLRAIRCATRCNKNSDWHTLRIHGQGYFTVEPRSTHSLLAASRARRIRMNLAATGIDHQPFKIGLIDQKLKQRFP